MNNKSEIRVGNIFSVDNKMAKVISINAVEMIVEFLTNKFVPTGETKVVSLIEKPENN